MISKNLHHQPQKKENHFRNSLLVAGTGLEPMTFGL